MKKWIIIGILLIGAIYYFTKDFSTSSSSNQSAPEFAKVETSDMLISVKESGYLNAVKEEIIKNEIKTGSIKIIDIVPNGSVIKKGDFLIELDRHQLEETKTNAEIAVDSAEASLVEAKNSLEIEKSKVASEIDAAKSQIGVKKMDLEKFEVLEKAQKIRDAKALIETAEDKYKLAKENYENSVALAKKGFETKNTVDRDKLDLSSNEKQLKTAKSKLEILEQYDLVQEKSRLTRAHAESKNNLLRLTKQGESRLLKAEAKYKSSVNQLKIKKKKLENYTEQLKKTKIYAPLSGYALYPKTRYYDDSNKIEKGKEVRMNQPLIRIPDMSAMKVDISVVEQMIGSLKVGQKAYVTIDSLGDKKFNAKVSRVNVLPEAKRYWEDSKAQKYKVVVLIDEGEMPDDVKPQISASLEIIIEELQQVKNIPIQAVHTVEGEKVVYVKDGDHYELRKVKLGQMNSTHVVILEGLKNNDQVLITEPHLQ